MSGSISANYRNLNSIGYDTDDTDSKSVVSRIKYGKTEKRGLLN